MQALSTMGVDDILKEKYPAKAHTQRVVGYIRAKIPHAHGFIFLSGCADRFYDDTDLLIPFRQRRAFMYLTGINIPDCHLLYDIGTLRSTLFIPPMNHDDILWSGLPLMADEVLTKYDVDVVLPSTELRAVLKQTENRENETEKSIFTIADHVGPNVAFPSGVKIDSTILKEAIDECRVVKDQYEISLIKKASDISSAAHRAVLENVKKCRNESEIEGIFLAECMKRGAKVQAYPAIVASGHSAATMHYESNDQPLYINGKAKDLVLVDAGAEWNCYGADITRTLPVSGKFTKESRAIYDIVLETQQKCIEMLKEGVLWDDAHLLAHRTVIDGLLGLGILKGDKDEILAAKISTAFMPHGLGHFLGMDTHDTGGHPNETESDPLFRYLRLRRHLPAGCIVTVEPGIHFCKHTIHPFLNDYKSAKYIDEKVLDQYWDVGGVCIEDDILVTNDGSFHLSNVTKDPDEIERIISGNR